MIDTLIRKNRSYRRFHQNDEVSADTLKELVNLARLTGSAANLQPLKYVIANGPEKRESIFPCLSWAGYLKDWPGPKEGERPAAYIIVLGDTEIAKTIDCDHGIAAQTMLLAAVEKGLGGCMIGSINRPKLMEALNIPERYRVLLVLALGRPNEQVVIEEARGDIRYWRDERGVHHVPKRPLEEIILHL